jgi:hypothetical protein
MPDWNPILGNLGAMAKVKMTLPLDAHQNYVIAELSKDFIQQDVPYYLDTFVLPSIYLDISTGSCTPSHIRCKPYRTNVESCRSYYLKKLSNGYIAGHLALLYWL